MSRPELTGWTVEHDVTRLQRIMSWVRWVLAGCPRYLPVVIRRGAIDVCPHGHIEFRDWTLDSWRSEVQPHMVKELVEGLEKIYGHTRVSRVPGCLDCRWVDVNGGIL